MRGEVSLPERLNQLARAEATRRRRELERDSRVRTHQANPRCALVASRKTMFFGDVGAVYLQ
jgi:hypothetical protein